MSEMTVEKQDLTTGPLGKKILLFSLPLMISNLLQVLFNMADVAVVGQFAGSLALGSVGSTSNLVALFTGFLIGLSGGINVLTALRFGAKDRRGIIETVHSAAILSLLTGIFLTVTGVGFSRSIMTLLNTKPELIDGAVLYFRIYLLGMPAMALYNFGNAVFSAVGNTKKPLMYLSNSGVLNVILNLFFVVVCNMSVAGVALASVLSQYLSAVLIVSALFRSKEVFGLRMSELRLDKSSALQIAGIGFPAGIQNVIFQVANLFVQVGVNTFDATMVAGNSAAANADNIVFDIMTAFYTACASFMGQNYGAGKKKRLLRSYFISLAYAFGTALIVGWLLVAFGHQFLSLFTKDPAVVEAGMKRLTIMGSAYCLSAFMDCSIAASRALGKSLAPTVIVIMGSCVFRVIWIYTIFAHFQTIPSLYMLYVFSWTITSIAEIIYFAKIYKKQTAKLVPNILS